MNTLVCFDDASNLRKTVGTTYRLYSFEEIYSTGSPPRKEEEQKEGYCPPGVEALEWLFTLGYTSGTTGRPKLVMLNNRSTLVEAVNILRAIPFTERDSGFLFLPLTHGYA